MKVEIECKIHLPNPAKTQALIAATGSIDKGEVFEQNWIFDKNHELEKHLSLLRLRVTDNNEWGILTHKSPLAEKKFKRRREIETKVDNAHNLRLIIESLGYGKIWYYEKKRHTYKLNDKAEIVLDTTPELGTFIEIEAADEDIISELVERFNLDMTNNLLISYREIWKQHCQQKKIPFCDWMFQDSPNLLIKE